MKQIVVTEKLMVDYKDEKQCFGSKEKGFCFDENEDCCSVAECVDRELCKALFAGAVPILQGEKIKHEPNLTVVSKNEWNREIVLAVVLEAIENKGFESAIAQTATRDKVFINQDDVFIVTKKALKIHRLENGNVLNVEADLWKEDNKGIVVTYDPSLDFKVITELALDALYTPQPEPITEGKKDLFQEDEYKIEPTKKEPTKKEPIEQVTKPLAEVAEPVDLGEVIKILKVTNYSKGFNEISITFKGDVNKMIKKFESILSE